MLTYIDENLRPQGHPVVDEQIAVGYLKVLFTLRGEIGLFGVALDSDKRGNDLCTDILLRIGRDVVLRNARQLHCSLEG